LSQWHVIKLELAPIEEFPNGSPGRAFLLRLPLGRDGTIDGARLADAPRSAFVRRFWPNEPDRSGMIFPCTSGWTLAFAGEETGQYCVLEDGPATPGNVLTVRNAAGVRLPFRVLSVKED